MKNILFVALPSELPQHTIPDGVDVVYTGVGKINAAIAASLTLKDLDPQSTRVINFGSAGSALPKMHLYRCTSFSQHDMNAEPLSPLYHTPFDSQFHTEPTHLLTFDTTGHTCATQDTFEQNPKDDYIYDMESYALAKVCKKLGFHFICFKFVSDGGDASDWERNHDKGIHLFLKELNDILL